MNKLHRFPENLKVIRNELHLTQEQLAHEVQCCETLISHWESGYSDPSFNRLVKLESILKCGFDILIKGKK